MRAFPMEMTLFEDSKTGVMIRQLTDQSCINHHPFFLIPAYDEQMQWIFFVSHRSGSPQIYGFEQESSAIVQFTDVEDLTEWSVHPDLSGRFVYFTTKIGGWQLDVASGKVRSMFHYGEAASRASGMVAGGMGTTALSHHGTYWAFPFNTRDGVIIKRVDTRNGNVCEVTTHDAVGHMQFCPDDEELLYFAGNFTERLWTVKIDGSGKKKHGTREKGQWITHESWIPGTRELMYVDWPHAVRSISIDDGTVKTICRINAWHAICDASGQRVVADTNSPDRGINVFNVSAAGEPQVICYPQASNAGEHWHHPFPYEDGPIKVVAPQHTHPHPRFSPDGRRIVYTSDVSGHAQLYEALLP